MYRVSIEVQTLFGFNNFMWWTGVMEGEDNEPMEGYETYGITQRIVDGEVCDFRVDVKITGEEYEFKNEDATRIVNRAARQLNNPFEGAGSGPVFK